MKKYISTIFFLSCIAMVNAQYNPLYKKIPNYIDAPDEESSAVDGVLRISNVSIPGYIFFSAGTDVLKPCVVICPGGGYRILASEHEGTDVAKYFNSIGMHALVLKYRIPSDEHQPDKKIAPLQDAQRAVQLVREHAKEWKVDPNKVGIMGFSAGGHLASSLAVHYDDIKIKENSKLSVRPDFQILGYPVISFSKFSHVGSRKNLLGKDSTESMMNYFSNEMHVNSNTPIAFLVHAKDDKVVPIENSHLYVDALKSNGVEAELFVYETGGHGFGMINKTSPESWINAMKAWLQKNKIIQ
ncbi:MAG: alpha/beta hydrolase [Bacteroidota bacterium]|jgi:acetyl esterase/lipase